MGISFTIKILYVIFKLYFLLKYMYTSNILNALAKFQKWPQDTPCYIDPLAVTGFSV